MQRRGWAYLAARGAAVAFGVLEPIRVGADEWSTTVARDRHAPTHEISGGVDAKTGGWAGYAGYMMAIGGNLYQDGWRLRLMSGYGNYWFGKEYGASFRGAVTFGEVLAGYQLTYGALTVKLFAGLAGDIDGGSGWDQRDDFRRWWSTTWTAKGAVETWLNLTDHAFGQLDVSYFTLDQSYSTRLRLGYRLSPHISIGPELRLSGNLDYGDSSNRVGGFVRLESVLGEVSISGGAATDRGEAAGAYGTANLLYRF